MLEAQQSFLVVYCQADLEAGKRIENLITASGYLLAHEGPDTVSTVLVVLSPDARRDRQLDIVLSDAVDKKELTIACILVHPDIANSIPYELADFLPQGRQHARFYNFIDAPEEEIKRFCLDLPVLASATGVPGVFSLTPDEKLPVQANISPRNRRGPILIVSGVEDSTITNRLRRYLHHEGLKVKAVPLNELVAPVIQNASAVVPVLTASNTEKGDRWTAALHLFESQQLRLFPVVVKPEAPKGTTSAAPVPGATVTIPWGLRSVQYQEVSTAPHTLFSTPELDLDPKTLARTLAASLLKYTGKQTFYFRKRSLKPWSVIEQFQLFYWTFVTPRRLLDYYVGTANDLSRLRSTYWWLACTLAILIYGLAAPEMLSVVGIYETFDGFVWLPQIIALWAIAGIFGGFRWRRHVQAERLPHLIGGVLFGLLGGLSADTLTRHISGWDRLPAAIDGLYSGSFQDWTALRSSVYAAANQIGFTPPLHAIALLLVLTLAFACAARSQRSTSIVFIVSGLSTVIFALLIPIGGHYFDPEKTIPTVVVIGSAMVFGAWVPRLLKMGHRTVTGTALFLALLVVCAGLFWAFYIASGLKPVFGR